MSVRPLRFTSPASRLLQLDALALRVTAAPLDAPTYFDAAPAAVRRDTAIPLAPGDVYDPTIGYGWSQPPTAAFSEPSWSGIRSPALCDGVSGGAFALRLGLARGRWTALVFLDDGFGDAHAVELRVNGRVHRHNPRVFGLEEEPAVPPINRYRVAQIAIDSSGGATTFEFAHASLGLVQAWASRADRAAQPAGSAGWAADQLLRSARFWGVVAQWRLETGDARFDSLLRRHAPPYLRFRLGGGTDAIVEGIPGSMLEHLRYNTPLRTTEVLFTDRIHVAQDVGNWDGTDLVLAMLTGNHASGMSRYYHVAWEDAPQTFTALVTAAGSRELAADIFLHQTGSAPVTARLFRLAPGRYRLVAKAGGRILLERSETIAAPDHRLTVEIAGATLVQLNLTAEANPSSP